MFLSAVGGKRLFEAHHAGGKSLPQRPFGISGLRAIEMQGAAQDIGDELVNEGEALGLRHLLDSLLDLAAKLDLRTGVTLTQSKNHR